MAPDKVPPSASELRKRETVTISARADPRRTIRTAKSMGLRNLPSKTWVVNCGWVLAANLAADLAAWIRLLGLYD